MQPPVPIDPVWQTRIDQVYRSGSGPWVASETSEPLPSQIEPLLGEDAEPDPTFFVESWMIGLTSASENYLRRHAHDKRHESPAPAAMPSFSFVTFLNVDPPAQAAFVSPSRPAGAVREFPAPGPPENEDTLPFVPGPLTFQSARHLLGVTAASTREEIRAAYRRMASRYHPDRLAAAGAADPKLVSDRMASINEAYRLLCEVRVERSA